MTHDELIDDAVAAAHFAIYGANRTPNDTAQRELRMVVGIAFERFNRALDARKPPEAPRYTVAEIDRMRELTKARLHGRPSFEMVDIVLRTYLNIGLRVADLEAADAKAEG